MGGSRETKEQKGTGGGRTGYGKREVFTPLSPPTDIPLVAISVHRAGTFVAAVASVDSLNW